MQKISELKYKIGYRYRLLSELKYRLFIFKSLIGISLLTCRSPAEVGRKQKAVDTLPSKKRGRPVLWTKLLLGFVKQKAYVLYSKS